MPDKSGAWCSPVFFERNRVFRVYLGGKLLHDFTGDPSEDGNEPEEWICSNVHAINPGHTDPLEGISKLLEDGRPFTQLLAEAPEKYLGDRKNLGVLVKFLDSAIRLPMQVHPTREFSLEHFDSPYGKAESWLVLATRPGACIYFGFSREITKDEFGLAVARGETEKGAMTKFVNRAPVKRGDVFFVPAGVIHALGAGCLVLEVQEPTDFTIQPEYWCGDYRLNSREMYLGLPPEVALDCFDYRLYGPEIVEKYRKIPCIKYDDGHVRAETLIGAQDTPCFSMERYTLTTGAVRLCGPASIWVCISGEGAVTGDNYRRKLSAGDYFFLPAYADGRFRAESENHMELVRCEGGKEYQ